MKSAEDIKQYFRKSTVSTNPDRHEAIFERIVRAQDRLGTIEPALNRFSFRSIIMKNPLTKLATAAIVAIACLIGLSLWRGTESGIALADVLARVEKVKAVRSKLYIKISGDPNYPWSWDNPRSFEIRQTLLTSQEYGSKSNLEWPDPNGGESMLSETYFLRQKKLEIVISHKYKSYKRTELDDAQVERFQNRKDENFRRDPLAFLKEIADHKHKSLGRSTMDGNEVEVFQSTDPNYARREYKNRQVDAKIWVDVKTRLPVRYEQRVTAQRVDRVWSNQQILYYDFQWDVHVDASEFEPVIPDGYTSLVVKYPAHITEETAIQGLKLLVELLGKYPEKITDIKTVLQLAEKSETPAALRLKEELNGLTEDEEIQNNLVDFLVPIRGLAQFHNTRRDRAYYGEAVTPKDADKVLMRWKVSDNEYRVIFGDLHAETVTPAKLAELEKTLPK